MRWIIHRIGQAILTVIAVITISFGLVRFLPGGPLDYIRARLMAKYGTSGSTERIHHLVQVYANIRPDKPVWIQYLNYVWDVLHLDFGKSMLYARPVANIIAGALPWTVFIMSLGLIGTFVLGITLGAVMAYKESSRFDLVGTVGSISGYSVPYYVLALGLLYILGYRYGLFPTSGRLGEDVAIGLTVEFFVSALYHATLPVLSIVLTEFGGWAINMRGNSIQELGEDYIRVARLRGLSTPRIALRYVGRNAILPMYTNLMVAIGFIFGGSVILEQIFAYPGIGFYMVRGINARDYPLVMGIFIVLTLAVVVGVFVADLTYGLIDPRIRMEGEGQ